MHSDEEDLKAPGFGLKTYLRVPPPHVYETSPSVLRRSVRQPEAQQQCASETVAGVVQELRLAMRLRGGAFGTRVRKDRTAENARRRAASQPLLPRGFWDILFPDPNGGTAANPNPNRPMPAGSSAAGGAGSSGDGAAAGAGSLTAGSGAAGSPASAGGSPASAGGSPARWSGHDHGTRAAAAQTAHGHSQVQAEQRRATAAAAAVRAEQRRASAAQQQQQQQQQQQRRAAPPRMC